MIKKLLTLNNLLALQLFVLGIANLFSRSLTETVFVLFALTYLIYGVRQRIAPKYIFPPINFDLLYISWFLILIVSHLVNHNLNEHEISEIGEYRWLLGIYFISGTLLLTGLTPKIMGYFFAAVSTASIYFIWDFFIHPRYPQYIGYPNRMTGNLFSPTDFGHTILFLFLLSSTFLLFSKPKQSSVRYWLISLTTAATGLNLFFSQTRAVFVAALICILAMAASISKKLMINLLLLSIATFSFLYYFDILGFKERTDYSLEPDQTYQSARVKLWEGHLEMIKENFFFGVGYHHNQLQLRSYYDRLGFPKGTHEAHAHNQFLNILAGTGLFGLLWYILVMGLFIKQGCQNIRQFEKSSFDHILATSSVSILIGFLLSGLTDTNFELMAPKYYLLFTWAIIIYQSKKSKPLDKLSIK